MKIEENMSDENKDEQTKRTVEANSIECPKLRINSDICYCDRAPGSSRSIATKPHLKASYCVETKSNKTTAVAAAVADTAANKSNVKTTRDSSRDDKLSPIARDFSARNKTTRLQDTVKSDDIFTISRESFPGPRSAKGRLEKSIFSCVSPVCKTKPSTVIIEELPSEEACEKPTKPAESSEAKVAAKKETSVIEERSSSTKKSCANKNKASVSLEKESKTSLTPSKIQAGDKCEKSRKTIDSSETRVVTKNKMKEEKDMSLNKKSSMDKNKKLISPEKEGKNKASITSNKIIANEYRKESMKLEMDRQV